MTSPPALPSQTFPVRPTPRLTVLRLLPPHNVREYSSLSISMRYSNLERPNLPPGLRPQGPHPLSPHTAYLARIELLFYSAFFLGTCVRVHTARTGIHNHTRNQTDPRVPGPGHTHSVLSMYSVRSQARANHIARSPHRIHRARHTLLNTH